MKSTHVSVVVRIFGVASGGNGTRASNSAVDGPDGPEGVDVDFEICQRLVRAGLEGLGVASRGRVKGVDGSEHGVSVFATADSAITGVDIGDDKSGGRRPVGLEEAEDVVGLGGPSSDDTGRITECGSESNSLAESAVLDGGGEEGCTIDLFPEIKPGAVPVVGNVVEIEQEDRPEGVPDVGSVRLGDQVVGKGDDGSGAKSRSISLRTTPATGECGFTDQEFRFAESTGRNGSTGVGDLLDSGHAGDPVVDARKECGVTAGHVAINDVLVNERRVSDPGVSMTS